MAAPAALIKRRAAASGRQRASAQSAARYPVTRASIKGSSQNRDMMRFFAGARLSETEFRAEERTTVYLMALQRDQPSASIKCWRSSREKVPAAGTSRGRPGHESRVPCCGCRSAPAGTLCGGLRSGAYAKVFEASWVGASNKNGGTVPSPSRSCVMWTWSGSSIHRRRFVVRVTLRRLREAPGVVSLYGCSTPSDDQVDTDEIVVFMVRSLRRRFSPAHEAECYMTLPDARRLTRELVTGETHPSQRCHS